MRVGEIRHPERAQFGAPLAGVRILAVEQMQALPYATQLMAHLGADVVKVEHPVHGESGRGAQPAVIDSQGRSVGATFLRNSLSKRSIGIDLKSDAGRELFKRLVPHFDIVGENFRPGTMGRLGLSYEVLAEIHPGLIYVSVSGFGHLADSPYAAWPAYAPIAEAMAGFYEQNRVGDEPPRPIVAGALGDIGSALFATIGTLAALRHRERTGLGQQVDVAMYDAMVAMADIAPFMWSMGAPENPMHGGDAGLIAGFAARDGYFVVEVIREHQFRRLAELVGHPEWCDDPRFATRRGWGEHTESVIRPAVESWARAKTPSEACHLLCAAGVAAGPSHTAADNARDPHLRARDMLIEVPRPDGGAPLLVVGNPVKLSRVAEGPVRSFPELGEHTDALLRELLEFGDAEIEALHEAGAI
jgi:formyl-CoA transferase